MAASEVVVVRIRHMIHDESMHVVEDREKRFLYIFWVTTLLDLEDDERT